MITRSFYFPLSGPFLARLSHVLDNPENAILFLENECHICKLTWIPWLRCQTLWSLSAAAHGYGGNSATRVELEASSVTLARAPFPG